MAAPIGNKFAYGNPHSGRPPTWTKEIIEEEARLFLEWAQRDDSLVLRKFAGLRGYPHKYLYRWKDENEVFCHAYEIAQTIIGTRREEYILEKAIPRDLPMYFEELHKFEKEREAYTASLKEKKIESETALFDSHEKELSEQLPDDEYQSQPKTT